MSSGPLVIADPCGIGLTICRELVPVGSGGTLAWNITFDLRDAADVLSELGWDALLVDGDNEPLSTAAMSHLAQIRGMPSVLIIGVDAEALVEQTLNVATMAARHLPEVTVVFAGRQAEAACGHWGPVAEGLELNPEIVALGSLGVVASRGSHHHMSERIA